MSRERSKKVVITFHTTTQAMLMEQSARNAGASGRLIPVPGQISSGCGMAWCVPPEERPAAEAVVREYGIETEGIYELLL